MFSIGEFSKVTNLPVKTLRFYHEQGVLVPTQVDSQTGYRYYAEGKIETARLIRQLRKLDFTLADIKEILSSYHDGEDILEYFERQRQTVQLKLREYRTISKTLDQIISEEREARVAMKAATYEVEEKTVDSMLIAGVRMTGRYSDCGRGFAQIGKQYGRYICGKALLLQYDDEYKEEDAEFEACLPMRQGAKQKGTGTGDVTVRELAGGRCVSLLHKGPYDELGRSYGKILAYATERGYEIQRPTREVYIKGPGMIFKGNPKKYLTEIQFLIRE